MDNFYVLSEGCISQILSLTSPWSSAISFLFKAAADSDGVWEKFLPSDYRQIISRSASPIVFPIKKQLYLSLCDSPLLLDGGKLTEKAGRSVTLYQPGNSKLLGKMIPDTGNGYLCPTQDSQRWLSYCMFVGLIFGAGLTL